MVQDLVHNLCESLVENIDGVAGIGKKTPPTPITYLTQWKIVGDSEVHTLPYPDGIVLPQGYKRCEYLTFDGSSYINTGVKTANDIGCSLDFSCIRENKLLIGARKSPSIDGYCVGAFLYSTTSAKVIYVSYGGATNPVICQSNYVDNQKHHLVLDSNIFRIDSEDLAISHTIAESFYDIYLGTLNNKGTADTRMWEGGIYDTLIYNTQGELWHGIPCLDANDVPCFYDIVSQTAFYNQGSGSFTYKLYPQPTEIWSCGEYNATDGKYHILVQPLGGSIADIALTEPLRKVDDVVNDVADKIEFANNVATVTRNIVYIADISTLTWMYSSSTKRFYFMLNNNVRPVDEYTLPLLVCSGYESRTNMQTKSGVKGMAMQSINGVVGVYDSEYTLSESNKGAFIAHVNGMSILYAKTSPTTELVDAPQIAEADSYSMVISQGGKAVEWSGFYIG